MPAYIDFENRAKRKEMMKQFRQESVGNDIPGYQEYLKNMEALDTLMDEYSEYDSIGLPKDLTAWSSAPAEDMHLRAAVVVAVTAP